MKRKSVKDILASSREFVGVEITSGLVDDQSTTRCWLAFCDHDLEPDGPEWIPAQFTSPTRVECLVGPGGAIELEPGDYEVWARVETNVEVPVKHAGTLVVQ